MIDFISLVVQYGAVAVLMLGFGALIHGDLRTRWEVAKVEQAANDAIGRLDARIKSLLADHEARMTAVLKDHENELAAVRIDCERRVAEVTRDRDYYRAIVLRLLPTISRQTEVNERAVRAIVRDDREDTP